MAGVAGKIGVAALGSTAGAAADTAAAMLLAGAIAGTSATYKISNAQHSSIKCLKVCSSTNLYVTGTGKAGLAAC